MIIIVDFFQCYLLWLMIYYAHKYCPVIPGLEDNDMMEMRDRIACDDIISRDDILTTRDSPLFLQILQIIDLVRFTVFPAMVTFAWLFIMKKMSSWG